MPHRYAVKVRQDDLDNLGHVNNARYLDYLERGRTAWYDESELVERCHSGAGGAPLGTVVVNVNIDFRDECVIDDELIVVTRPARVGTKSFAVSQTIEKVSGSVAAEASVTSVVMNLADRVAITLPSAVKQLF